MRVYSLRRSASVASLAASSAVKLWPRTDSGRLMASLPTCPRYGYSGKAVFLSVPRTVLSSPFYGVPPVSHAHRGNSLCVRKQKIQMIRQSQSLSVAGPAKMPKFACWKVVLRKPCTNVPVYGLITIPKISWRDQICSNEKGTFR